VDDACLVCETVCLDQQAVVWLRVFEQVGVCVNDHADVMQDEQEFNAQEIQGK
jgi:hypothetical protein